VSLSGARQGYLSGMRAHRWWHRLRLALGHALSTT